MRDVTDIVAKMIVETQVEGYAGCCQAIPKLVSSGDFVDIRSMPDTIYS